MATLTKPKVISGSSSSAALDSGIPKPFPRDLLATFDTEDQSERVGSVDADNAVEATPPNLVEQTQHLVSLKDVMPSIVHVQRSCLMTLNNLLSGPTAWHPILPDRRHSMPSSAQGTATLLPSESSSSPNSALQTLLTNLRNHESDGEMIEARPHDTDMERLREVERRIQSISSSLPPTDAALAKALVSLLSDLYRLAEIQAIAAQPSSTSVPLSDVDTNSILDAPPPADIFDALTRQLGDLQIERISSQAAEQLPGASPLLVVEHAMIWTRVDAELENVMSLCRQRTETLPKFSTQSHRDDHLPPEYDHDVHDYRHHVHDDMESLPDYEANGRTSFDDSKSHKQGLHQAHDSAPLSTRSADEKMRMDLESVTMAIDRLYLVAPQLHNQRVELKSSKLEELEKARREGASSSSSASRSRAREEPDVKDLENIFMLLSKASERSMKDQSVILDSRMQSRLEERTKAREQSKRDALLSSLIEHSEAGRLHDQDAVLKLKDPEALLSLPEFIRESMPMSERLKDPQALLSLPEFVKEPVPSSILDKQTTPLPPPIPEQKGKKKRHRSLSAPPLAWLRSKEGRSQNGSGSSTKGKTKASESAGSDKTAFDVIYVAENHENLHHVLVFFTVTGGRPGHEIQAEVLPPLIGKADEGDHLIIKSGPHTSLPLLLPAHTTPGKKQVQKQGGHWVIKLSTVPSPPSSSSSSSSSSEGRPVTPPDSQAINGPLLDATQLSALNPTSFLCSSCSLPLVSSSKVDDYRDLPSEHWQELVEAWMCHGDIRLNEQVADRGKSGFWPTHAGQGLVGGSYLLFDEGAMNSQNLLLGEADEKSVENWHLARCICGAIIGRWQDRISEQSKENVRTFRVLKYAVRPVSQTSEPSKVPLSAFIVNDMLEYVQAHATYRFVIRDEEEERPRILIWLFKPKIRLAYTTPTSRAIPKSASILGAKVLYKLLKPSDDAAPFDLKAVLNKYPGFPQAEFLSYPMPICRRIAGLLKESSTAYPENLRTMTGLEVGWLQRV